jgi:hypothetical protein
MKVVDNLCIHGRNKREGVPLARKVSEKSAKKFVLHGKPPDR